MLLPTKLLASHLKMIGIKVDKQTELQSSYEATSKSERGGGQPHAAQAFEVS